MPCALWKQAVGDGVGVVGVADDGGPSGDLVLAGGRGRGGFGAVVGDLVEVAAFGVAQGREHRVVYGEQVQLCEAGERRVEPSGDRRRDAVGRTGDLAMLRKLLDEAGSGHRPQSTRTDVASTPDDRAGPNLPAIRTVVAAKRRWLEIDATGGSTLIRGYDGFFRRLV